jgi:hypothetical protein
MINIINDNCGFNPSWPCVLVVMAHVSVDANSASKDWASLLTEKVLSN